MLRFLVEPKSGRTLVSWQGISLDRILVTVVLILHVSSLGLPSTMDHLAYTGAAGSSGQSKSAARRSPTRFFPPPAAGLMG